jgi:hypothetical protein
MHETPVFTAPASLYYSRYRVTMPKQGATIMANTASGRSRGRTARAIETYQPGNVALGTATAVHAAVTDTGAQQVITTAITSPDVPRTIIATPGGTTGNVTAVSCIVAGTDISGAVLTETLPAFAAGAATARTSVNAFATVTSITQPAIGTAVTVSYGTTAQLGMPQRMSRNTVLAAYLAGVKEATPPTVTTHATDRSKTLAQLNSALNGTAVVIDFYES